MVDTARFAMKSSTGAHDAPALVDLQMPPPTLPANMLFVFEGRSASRRTASAVGSGRARAPRRERIIRATTAREAVKPDRYEATWGVTVQRGGLGPPRTTGDTVSAVSLGGRTVNFQPAASGCRS